MELRGDRLRQSSVWGSRPVQTCLVLFVVLSLLYGGWGVPTRIAGSSHSSVQHALSHEAEHSSSVGKQASAFRHLLIPASNRSPDLCKLVITATALSYPQPHLLAWEETFDKKWLVGGGSHLAKVSRTLDYLNALKPENDDDLVMMMDGYDIWIQLPAQTLVQRYNKVVEGSRARMEERFGSDAMGQARKQGLHQSMQDTVLFGAGKRCAPNQIHTIACYTLPSSPLPKDLYGANTDTKNGWNKWSSQRQVGLNSGYIIAPVRAMRKMFAGAEDYILAHQEAWSSGAVKDGNEEADDGTGGSWHMYHGSDQSVFDKMLGRQEFIREVLRRRLNPSAGSVSDPHKSGIIGWYPVDDRIAPSTAHEAWNDGKIYTLGQNGHGVSMRDHLDPWAAEPKDLLDQYDFGITLDYFSDLGHQTANSVRDAAWLSYDGQTPLIEQIERERPRDEFDCRVPLESAAASGRAGLLKSGRLPRDVLGVDHPLVAFPDTSDAHTDTSRQWEQTPLYTHVCLETIPVMIHHNGDKTRRWKTWSNMAWVYKAVEPYLMGARSSDKNLGSVRTDKGQDLAFNDLCPKAMLDDGGVFGAKG